jgi:hypothetical protein
MEMMEGFNFAGKDPELRAEFFKDYPFKTFSENFRSSFNGTWVANFEFD